MPHMKLAIQLRSPLLIILEGTEKKIKFLRILRDLTGGKQLPSSWSSPNSKFRIKRLGSRCCQ